MTNTKQRWTVGESFPSSLPEVAPVSYDTYDQAITAFAEAKETAVECGWELTGCYSFGFDNYNLSQFMRRSGDEIMTGVYVKTLAKVRVIWLEKHDD